MSCFSGTRKFTAQTDDNDGDDSGYENGKEVDYANEKIIGLWYASFCHFAESITSFTSTDGRNRLLCAAPVVY
jgi:hypothetical protein